ncbi:hypothetical protein SAMN05444266_11167 [Chitinophaga jiangningensis]|uniref:Uncharacterized protein n=1 Tax=Chitinophaga jiangningensis TaxID=1419482 RepID=A0A1M7LP74_9BACT|nr:hypothetical protein [Chitinophaga jiangningensis]SHM79957.1 hypothetical protein SAMN05444266_11167 [Chitinophaga jiangningensis]
MMYKLLLFIPWLLLSEVDKRYISGQFYVKRAAVSPFPDYYLEITAESNGSVIGKGLVDSSGHFFITLDKPAAETDIFYTGLGLAKRYVATVNMKKAPDTSLLNIRYPLRISMGNSGRAICPKCKQDDATVPVKDGDGVPQYQHFFEHDPGDFSKYADIPHYSMETCIRPANAPDWICARDRIFF